MGIGSRKGLVLTSVFEQVALTGSTNADLLARADEAPEGLWLRADAQDGGRGRLGREWRSPTGNLYVSTIVHWRANNPPPATIAFVSAVAVYDAIAELAPDIAIQIKWPNDLLSGMGEKFCGILLERNGDAIVVGFGVNLAWHPEGLDRPVTSLGAMDVAVPTPQQTVEILAQHFARWLLRWRTEGTAPVIDAWQARAHPPGTAVTARLPDGEGISGHYAGLDSDGALRLCLADGSIRAIHAGDIFLV